MGTKTHGGIRRGFDGSSFCGRRSSFDDTTGELMKRFYHEMLQRDLPPAAALRQAQIEMWQSKEWNAPFYWAAFVIQGDWK
jgi:CHAT domain-containing protein